MERFFLSPAFNWLAKIACLERLVVIVEVMKQRKMKWLEKHSRMRWRLKWRLVTHIFRVIELCGLNCHLRKYYIQVNILYCKICFLLVKLCQWILAVLVLFGSFFNAQILACPHSLEEKLIFCSGILKEWGFISSCILRKPHGALSTWRTLVVLFEVSVLHTVSTVPFESLHSM